MYCPNCGKKNNDEKFCAYCGTQLSENNFEFNANRNGAVGNVPVGNAGVGNGTVGNVPVGNAGVGNGTVGNAPVGNAGFGNAAVPQRKNKNTVIAIVAVSLAVVAVLIFGSVMLFGGNDDVEVNQSVNELTMQAGDEEIIVDENEIIETTAKKVETKNTDAKSVLIDYYNKNYGDTHSAYTLFDFDKDGQQEMLATKQYFVEGSDLTKEYDLILIKVKDGSAYVSDKYVISDEKFDKYSVFNTEEAKQIASADFAQYIETYINSKGYISCNVFTEFNAWHGNYIILEVKNGKFSVQKNLLDPGYTSGNGLYYYNSYPDDGMLFSEDGGEKDKNSKYSSYKVALEKEIGVYGFEFKKMNPNDSFYEKYIVKDTDSVTDVCIFSNQN